jgi:hypothetical protein
MPQENAMPPEVPAVRILPMSHRLRGFRGKPIAQVQAGFFLRDLPACAGRYRYPSAGLNAAPGTLVLFQFQARIIASALFVRDEKWERPRGAYRGTLHFDPSSIRTFEPLDADALRRAWPAFRAFGHVKQRLNPARLSTFERQLQRVVSTSSP